MIMNAIIIIVWLQSTVATVVMSIIALSTEEKLLKY